MQATEKDHLPLRIVQVIEKEHGVSRSRFMAMRPAAFVFDCETDDSECCTKALRLVSGSDTAIHPRDWPNITLVDSGFELACAAYNLSF